MNVLKATNLTKIYGGQQGAAAVKALDGFNLTVEAGEFLGIMGPSGSGKTTLLQLLGTIDTPTTGEIEIGGQRLSSLRGNDLALFRRRRLDNGSASPGCWRTTRTKSPAARSSGRPRPVP